MTSNYPTDPADVLEAAAEVLETTAWIQGDEFRTDDGMRRVAYCAIGAIRQAVGFYDAMAGLYRPGHGFGPLDQHKSSMDVLQLSNEVANLMRRDDGTSVITWNDTEGRTSDEVIDLMKHTAKDLRNQKEAA
jgi:hypothetical protein